MKTLQHYFLLLPLLFVAAVLSGCGTSYLEMSRTVGYVDTQRGRMYVVSIEGQDAGSFRDQLYDALSDDGHFAIERYGIAPPQNPDSTMNMPCIVLSGIHSTTLSTSSSTEGSGKDEKKYKTTTESHEFQYLIKDAVTGEELDANVTRQDNVIKEEDKSTGFLDAVLGDIVKGAVADLVGVESAHRKALIRSFVATLRLHQEKRTVGLFEDKDIPELKEGLKLAMKRDWAGAISKFQAGVEGHPKSEALHKAYFNLGVAFEYNHEFDKALTSFRLADELSPEAGYGAEINYCKWFGRQYHWQQQHAGSFSNDPNPVGK